MNVFRLILSELWVLVNNISKNLGYVIELIQFVFILL